MDGKTEQARNDLARLAIIRKQREEAAAKRLAEDEGISVLIKQPRNELSLLNKILWPQTRAS